MSWTLILLFLNLKVIIILPYVLFYVYVKYNLFWAGEGGKAGVGRPAWAIGYVGLHVYDHPATANNVWRYNQIYNPAFSLFFSFCMFCGKGRITALVPYFISFSNWATKSSATMLYQWLLVNRVWIVVCLFISSM